MSEETPSPPVTSKKPELLTHGHTHIDPYY